MVFMPPSRRISTGNTALHEAAEAGNLEAALMLVDEGGANVEARTYREVVKKRSSIGCVIPKGFK